MQLKTVFRRVPVSTFHVLVGFVSGQSCSVPKTHHTHRWAAQIAHQGQLAHHIGKRQVSGVVTPGNIPGLVPGSAAAAQW